MAAIHTALTQCLTFPRDLPLLSERVFSLLHRQSQAETNRAHTGLHGQQGQNHICLLPGNPRPLMPCRPVNVTLVPMGVLAQAQLPNREPEPQRSSDHGPKIEEVWEWGG